MANSEDVLSPLILLPSILKIAPTPAKVSEDVLIPERKIFSEDSLSGFSEDSCVPVCSLTVKLCQAVLNNVRHFKCVSQRSLEQ